MPPPTRNYKRVSEGEKKAKPVPNIFTETRKLPEAALWEATEDKKIASVIKHQVYDLVPITPVPAGSKIIGSRCVYKIKVDDTRKASLVVLGWGMEAEVHCENHFAPVSPLQNIRMILALAEKIHEVLRYDVPTASLNSPVDKTIFVKMAPRREETDEGRVQQEKGLRKSLYGIPPAPANWQGTIDDFVTTTGLTPLKSDPCIYIYTPKDGIHDPVPKKGPTPPSCNKDTVILTNYVDELLLMG